MADKQYDSAIFFDNLKSHVRAIGKVCSGRIKSVHVGGLYDAPLVPFTDGRFRAFWERGEFKNNTYLRHTRLMSPDGDAYDPDSGIKEGDVREFNRWLERGVGGRRAVFLDWDRTITLFEGVVVEHTRNTMANFEQLFQNVNIEDALLYLCGGQQRLEMLRAMLRGALRAGVDIYILTNNTACSYRFFRDLVDGLIGAGKIDIICSGDAPYYNNKVRAIRRYINNCSQSMDRRRTGSYTRKRSSTSRRILNRTIGGKNRKTYRK